MNEQLKYASMHIFVLCFLLTACENVTVYITLTLLSQHTTSGTLNKVLHKLSDFTSFLMRLLR